MTDKPQAKFLTPAETIMEITRKIIAGSRSGKLDYRTNYYRNLNYKKNRELLRLALTGQLGHITEEQTTRIAETMEKLDEMEKHNQRFPKRPPAETTGEMF